MKPPAPLTRTRFIFYSGISILSFPVRFSIHPSSLFDPAWPQFFLAGSAFAARNSIPARQVNLKIGKPHLFCDPHAHQPVSSLPLLSLLPTNKPALPNPCLPKGWQCGVPSPRIAAASSRFPRVLRQPASYVSGGAEEGRELAADGAYAATGSQVVAISLNERHLVGAEPTATQPGHLHPCLP
jgi:hypothetical protein